MNLQFNEISMTKMRETDDVPPPTGLGLTSGLGCTLQVQLDLVQGGVEVLNAGLEAVMLASHHSLVVGAEGRSSLPHGLQPLQIS